VLLVESLLLTRSLTPTLKKMSCSNNVVPATDFVFPVSKRLQTRRLVLRNPTNEDYAIKVRASCPKLLYVEAANVIVHANEWLAIPVTLDFAHLEKPEDLKYHTISVFCRSGLIPAKNIAEWYENDSDDSLYLAQTLKVSRSTGFAAPDTVLDLPGSSTLLETPPYPTFDVDDSDCRTAHRFDSDTATATEISEDDFAAAVAPDSLISTAHNIDSGMPTARDVNDRGWCALGSMLSTFYPTTNLKVETSQKKSIFPCGAN